MNKSARAVSNDAEPERRDVLILGCGVSAMVAARVLARRGLTVTLVDHYSEPGGNHISVAVDDMVFDIGAIHFTAFDKFFEIFPEVRGNCVERAVTTQKLSPDKQVRQFPIEMSELTSKPIGMQLAIAWSALKARLRRGEPANAGDFIERAVGEVFFEDSGLRCYVTRLFGVAPEKIDWEFGQKRLRWVSRNTSIGFLLSQALSRVFGPGEERAVRSSQSPKTSLVRMQEGFATHYYAAVAGLREDGVQICLGQPIHRIERTEDGMRVVCEGASFEASRLVSTMPMHMVCDLAGLKAAKLKGVELLSLFVTFAGTRTFTGTVLYNFHPDGGWKRLTMFSDLYDRRSGREYFTVEVPLETGDGGTVEDAFERFVSHAKATGIFIGDLLLVAHMRLQNAYPLLIKGCGEERQIVTERLATAGISSLGRQGEFEYIPHQTVACAGSVAFADRLANEEGSRSILIQSSRDGLEMPQIGSTSG